jgi:hypothetical protein
MIVEGDSDITGDRSTTETITPIRLSEVIPLTEAELLAEAETELAVGSEMSSEAEILLCSTGAESPQIPKSGSSGVSQRNRTSPKNEEFAFRREIASHMKIADIAVRTIESNVSSSLLREPEKFSFSDHFPQHINIMRQPHKKVVTIFISANKKRHMEQNNRRYTGNSTHNFYMAWYHRQTQCYHPFLALNRNTFKGVREFVDNLENDTSEGAPERHPEKYGLKWICLAVHDNPIIEMVRTDYYRELDDLMLLSGLWNEHQVDFNQIEHSFDKNTELDIN